MASTAKRFTYGGDPAENDRDAVRFMVGDTNHVRPLLDDREVDWALGQEPNLNLAGALLAESLFGAFASKADISVGPVSKSYSKVAEMMKKKADQLRAEACKNARPSFPAIAIATKRTLEDNEGLVQPNFLIGLGDNRFAVQLNDTLDQVRFNGL